MFPTSRTRYSMYDFQPSLSNMESQTQLQDQFTPRYTNDSDYINSDSYSTHSQTHIFKGIEKEKPIGALIMAMQAVHVRRMWIDGEKSGEEATALVSSYEFNAWDAIINLVRQYLPELRADHTLNSTLADAAEEIEAGLNFVWPFEGANEWFHKALLATLESRQPTWKVVETAPRVNVPYLVKWSPLYHSETFDHFIKW
ncbi:hypothetical protein JOM56_007905 [Amanita muscaria]